ncbi:hypothetical protein Tco_0895257 [Tanacetum coccineum]|uniref:Uncharacterized protein n=1 Tax=Tanacetum coccineum TaxID=301880 RepID=A0ABQ5CE48_9ASTR
MIGDECVKGRMPNKTELTLEQSQQGVSNDVLKTPTLRFGARKPCQEILESTYHMIHKDGDGDASFQLESDSLPHAHAQTTKTYYKHQDSRIMKAQELKDKDFRTNSDIQDLPSKILSLSREIVSKLSR